MILTKERILHSKKSIKDLVRGKSKHPLPLATIQNLLNKIPLSLTQMVLEERKTY